MSAGSGRDAAMGGRAPKTRLLFVGDSTDIPEIGRRLEELSMDSYGQVYIEVATRIQIQRWRTPPNVTVAWLCRDRRGCTPDTFVARGELAAAALAAWAEEWMPEEAGDDRLELWVGCATSERVGEVYRTLHARLDAS